MSDIRAPLVQNEYYHIFNRGVARNPVFYTKNDYERALLTLSYYNFNTPPMKLSRYKKLPIELREELFQSLNNKEKIVDILSFVLMPNHFHFLLRQNIASGISKFVSKFTNSYTRYFNTRHDRVGPLFQGIFKAVHVETDEQLIHLSRYIHINPTSSFVIPTKDLFTYKWSSLPVYVGAKTSKIIESKSILAHFSNHEVYREFILDQVDYAKKREEIKHLTIE